MSNNGPGSGSAAGGAPPGGGAPPPPPPPAAAPEPGTIAHFLEHPLTLGQRVDIFEALRMTPAEIEAMMEIYDTATPRQVAGLDRLLHDRMVELEVAPLRGQYGGLTAEELAAIRHEALLEQIEAAASKPPKPQGPDFDLLNDPESAWNTEPARPGTEPNAQPNRPNAGEPPPRPQAGPEGPAENFAGRPQTEPAGGRPTTSDVVAEPAAPGKLASAFKIGTGVLVAVTIVDGIYRDIEEATTGQPSHGFIQPHIEGTPVEDAMHWFTANSPFFSAILQENDKLSHTWGAIVAVPLSVLQLAEVAGTQLGKLGNELTAIGELADDIIRFEVNAAFNRLGHAIDRIEARIEHRIDQAATLVVAVAEDPLLPARVAVEVVEAAGERIEQGLATATNQVADWLGIDLGQAPRGGPPPMPPVPIGAPEVHLPQPVVAAAEVW
jgi:hypothetical protein